MEDFFIKVLIVYLHNFSNELNTFTINKYEQMNRSVLVFGLRVLTVEHVLEQKTDQAFQIVYVYHNISDLMFKHRGTYYLLLIT